MYMTILSFVPMLFYLIPTGKYGNVYSVFHRMSYNGNLLSEGICLALTGALLIVTASMLDKKNKPLPQVVQAILIGIVAFLAVPTAGASLIAGVFCVAVLLGMSDKYALRYSMVLSTMVLIVMGIIEVCIGVTKISIISAVIGLIISAVITYFAVKVMIFVIKNKALKYFAWYDIVLGALCFVIGIFEIVIKH